jgi:hypothetical protein
MLKKIAITVFTPILIILLVGSVWVVGNLISYHNWWNSLSPQLRSELDNMGNTEADPIAILVWRGLGMGRSAVMEELREPRASILGLQNVVRQLEKKNRMMQAEIDDIKSEMEKRGKNNNMAEASRQ